MRIIELVPACPPIASASRQTVDRPSLEAYTLGSAFAAGRDKDLGSIEVGKLADLVVLSRDVLAEKERDAIASAEVVMTIVGGKVVYQKGR